MQQVQVLYLVKEFLVLCGWFSVAFTGSVLTRPSMEALTRRLHLILLMILYDIFGRLRQACVKKQCVGKGKEANVKRGRQPTVCKGINNGGSTKLRTKMITGSRLEMRNGETLSKGKDKMGKAVSVVSLFQRLSCSSLL